MPFPYDDNFEEDSGVFHEDERPTLVEGRRRRKRELAADRDYQHGRMVRAIIELRRDVDRLNSTVEELMTLRTIQPPPRPSIKPQVATAGVSVGVSAVIMTIWQLLHQAGIIK